MRLSRVLWMVLLPVVVWGQPVGPDTVWMRILDRDADEHLMQIRQAADGSLIVVGYSSPGGGALLYRLNAEGQTLWSRAYDSVQSSGQCILPTPTGCVFSGIARGTQGYDFYLTGTDSLGQELWTEPYVDPSHPLIPWSIEAAHGFGFVVGLDGSDGSVLLRTNDQGQELWRQSFDWTGHMALKTQVVPTPDGGYYVGSRSGIETSDYYLAKTDGGGQVQWTAHYGDLNDDMLGGLTLMPDGGCLLSGFTSFLGSSSIEVFLVRTTATGDTIWTRRYTQLGYSVAVSAAVDTDGDIIVYGANALTLQDRSDLLLLKIQADGELLWSRNYGTQWTEVASNLTGNVEGGLVMGASTLTNGQTWDFLIIKTAPRLSVKQPANGLPQVIQLAQNFPNPFNATTEISFVLPRAMRVSLKVYDLLGREVQTLLDERMNAGEQRVMFDGAGLASGIYFCRLEAEGVGVTRKMVLLK